MHKIDAVSSLQIKYCRLLCIFFMIMVHLPPGLDNLQSFPIPLEISKTITNDILGRASVSALSFISGFLIFHSLQRKSFRSLITNRFKTLVLPMVTWNLIIIAFGLLLFKLLGQKIYVIRELEGLPIRAVIIDRLFGVHYGSANDSLNFLRDMFVCSLLAFPLAKIAKRLSWLLIIILLAIDYYFTFQPIIMRGMILIFFAAGIVFAAHYSSLANLAKLRIPAFIGFCIVVSVEFSTMFEGFSIEPLTGYELLKRTSISILAVDLALILAKCIKSNWIDRFDRVIFFVFLSHNVAFILFWGIWQMFFGKSIEGYYLIFFLGAPIAWVSIVLTIYPILEMLPNTLQRLLMGKVTRPSKQYTPTTQVG